MADNQTEKQKVQELTDKLERGLAELFNSDSYKSYLSTMSKFHNYSFNNTLLIAMQKPEASLVAGYNAWQKNFGRHVNKGEKAIRILAPVPYKIKEEREKVDPITQEIMIDRDGNPQKEEVEITIPAFRAVSVFDVSQTDGKPITELEAKELLSDVEGYQDMIHAVEAVSPVPIEMEEIAGESKGYFDREARRIAVQENMSESQTLKTMIHEVAHSMLHNKEVEQEEQERKDRNTKEVEAESIAYTVCQHFGVDTSEYSFGYIAGWSSGRDTKELKSSMDTIRRTASELITGIEEQLEEIRKDREVSQEQHEASDARKAAQLLHGSMDKYGIYQLKDNPELDKFRFEGTESLKRMGITKYNFDTMVPENYEQVYMGELSEFRGRTQVETLEAIYTKFNIDHPADYKAHSLSVGDIVVLHENRENSAHFVDTFGFTGLPQFVRELEEKAEDLTVTFTVAECGEFHQIGAYYEDIPTIEEAIRIYREMDPARLNGVPAIGVNLHVEGTDCLEDDQVDLLTGNIIDVDYLNYMPDVRDHPSVRDAIKKLIKAFPEKEIIDRETKEQKIQELAGELDRLSYDMDPYEYKDTVEDREAQVANITEDIRSGNVGYLNDFLNAIIAEEVREGITDIFGQGTDISDSEAVQTVRKAKELLDKLAEYKPLAKIEEMEEQNYNMIDNVLNNGAEKKEDEKAKTRVSVKEKLAEKKAVIEKRDKAEKNCPEKDAEKKAHREI